MNEVEQPLDQSSSLSPMMSSSSSDTNTFSQATDARASFFFPVPDPVPPTVTTPAPPITPPSLAAPPSVLLSMLGASWLAE